MRTLAALIIGYALGASVALAFVYGFGLHGGAAFVVGVICGSVGVGLAMGWAL